MTTPVKITKKEWHKIAKDRSANGVWEVDLDDTITIIITKKFGKEVFTKQYRGGRLEKTNKYISETVSEDVGYNVDTGLVSSFAMRYVGESVVPSNAHSYYFNNNAWYHTQVKIVNGEMLIGTETFK